MKSRQIKPAFFDNELLVDIEDKITRESQGDPDPDKRENFRGLARICFAGLWCFADREGRFKWQVRRIKSKVLPHDDINFVIIMDALADAGLIVRYEVDGEPFGYIPNFCKHQWINAREPDSDLPAPPYCNKETKEGVSTLVARDMGGDRSKPSEGKADARTGPIFETTTGPWQPTTKQVEGWKRAHKDVDVDRQLELAASWVMSNQTRRKTKRGMPAFINRWLSNQKPETTTTTKTAEPLNPFE